VNYTTCHYCDTSVYVSQMSAVAWGCKMYNKGTETTLLLHE